MKPADKERLVRNRDNIIRHLDVSQIIGLMRRQKALSKSVSFN